MKNTYEDANVGCPYYNEETARTIICEGLMERSTVQQSFVTRGDKMKLKMQFCCTAWKTCPITKVLNQKYDYVP